MSVIATINFLHHISDIVILVRVQLCFIFFVCVVCMHCLLILMLM